MSYPMNAKLAAAVASLESLLASGLVDYSMAICMVEQEHGLSFTEVDMVITATAGYAAA